MAAVREYLAGPRARRTRRNDSSSVKAMDCESRYPREFVLSFEGGRWLAASGGVAVDGKDLPELEASLARAFRSIPALAARLPARVRLRFDYDSLPRWMRQYQAHYFNYSLDIDAVTAPEDCGAGRGGTAQRIRGTISAEASPEGRR